ncbi:MAG TPA: hypothetical protein VFO62_03440 [Candidatus Binatia bacterium]|nr:hypothetical protein [Candidatus Binatia bacterium]
MARVHRRYRKRKKNPSSDRAPSRNPTAFSDIVEFAGPGFAAFAATRFGTRVISTQVAKHKPSFGKHAGALASVGAFFAAWLLAHRVKLLAKYHTPIVVGSAIAALQSLIQIYVPRLGWMVADATPELAASSEPAAQQALSDVEVLDEDPAMYVYNDSYDPGRHTPETSAQRPQYHVPSQKVTEDDLMDLEMEEDAQQQSNGWAG